MFLQWALNGYEFKKIPNGSDLYKCLMSYSGEFMLTLKKEFPLKTFAKITKTFQIFQIFDKNLFD